MTATTAVEAGERLRVGATLRTYRELRGLTSDELATQMKISRPYLTNIENGRKPLTAVLLARACTVMKIRQIALVHPDAYQDAA